MASGFRFTQKEEEGGLRVELEGEITEDSNFTPLLEVRSERLVLDLSKIGRINSCGVREWISFVRALEGGNKEIVLDRCAVPIVHQLNMVSSFRGSARVGSVFAPYLCPDCEAQQRFLVEPGTSAPDSIPCAQCGGKMEFDDLRDAYFAFRKGA